jgi:hypothetical protein
MTRQTKGLDLYGTRAVAAILGIPEWRVKNFSQGEAYRLPPSVQAGKGRGTRRSYGWADIFRIGLADRLVEVGFTPKSVGRAVQQIPESTFAPYAALLHARPPERVPKGDDVLGSGKVPVLINEAGAWRLITQDKVAHEWSKTVDRGASDKGLFLINITNVCVAILDRLTRYWTGQLQETGE